MGIGENLKTLRDELNISQHDLAETFQVTPRMIRLYEKNKYHINSYAIEKLIEKYNVNPAWLFLNKGEMFLNDQLSKDYLRKLNIEDEEVYYLMKEALSSESKKKALLKIMEIFNSKNKDDILKMKEVLDLLL